MTGDAGQAVFVLVAALVGVLIWWSVSTRRMRTDSRRDMAFLMGSVIDGISVEPHDNRVAWTLNRLSEVIDQKDRARFVLLSRAALTLRHLLFNVARARNEGSTSVAYMFGKHVWFLGIKSAVVGTNQKGKQLADLSVHACETYDETLPVTALLDAMLDDPRFAIDGNLTISTGDIYLARMYLEGKIAGF